MEGLGTYFCSGVKDRAENERPRVTVKLAFDRWVGKWAGWARYGWLSLALSPMCVHTRTHTQERRRGRQDAQARAIHLRRLARRG